MIHYAIGRETLGKFSPNPYALHSRETIITTHSRFQQNRRDAAQPEAILH